MTRNQKLEVSREIRQWIKVIAGAGLTGVAIADFLMPESEKIKIRQKIYNFKNRKYVRNEITK